MFSNYDGGAFQQGDIHINFCETPAVLRICEYNSGNPGIFYATIAPNTWNHVAVVYNGSYRKIFINGNLEHTFPVTGLVMNCSRMIRVGHSLEPWPAHLDGIVDEVRISHSVRYTENFTPQLYLPTDAQTVGHWHFDEGTGNIVYDASVNGYNGSIYDATWVNGQPYQPSVIHVPGDYPTIQAGINAAQNGDTVLVADGTFTGVGNKNIDFLGKAIVVISENGAENCIIDCEGDGRGFYFHTNETRSSVLDGFKIINGAVTDRGGGIKIVTASPTIKNCIISNNHANGTGGEASGGGICAVVNASPLISNCTISNNTCNWCGGGIEIAQDLGGPPSSPIVEYCTIQGNTSTVCNGGIVISNTTTAIVKNTLIINNTGPEIGAMHCWAASPTIINCVISGNSGNVYAGGINLGWGGGEPPSSPTIKNTIIEGNTGVGIRSQGGSNPSVIYNDVYNNSGGNFSNMPTGLGVITTTNFNGDSCDTFFNIFEDPLFYSTTGDSAYHLAVNSPCIDAGDPNSPHDPDGTIADIGAYYFHQYLVLSPEELDFGLVGCGESLGQDFWVINNSPDQIVIYDIETTNPVFSTDFTPDDSLLAAYDFLELTVTFAPDDTMQYNDTLFVYSSVYTLFATLSGEGIAAIIQAEPDSLDFYALELGMDSTIALVFQNTGADTLEFYELVTSDPVFTVDFPAMSQPVLPGEFSDTCRVTFTPAQEILYEDSLFILCNAFNTLNDTFIVYLRGEGGIIPDTVRNLTIEAIYPDAVLTWEEVTTSIYGTPLTVDCYLIFFVEDYGLPFNFLDITFDTTYTHEYVVQFAPSMFYFAEAYIGEIGLLEEITASGEALSRDELYDLLK